ncbi:oxysterol-binding protein-related protein 2A-like isoform X3 [Carex littledalei]|uniref:Oxysterol-binding protein-related protein 2A-like isoform X3 n=1 Tax=Carex littledalei TaxID=544730 RepID=A0A833VIT2_9POAL|nr:oxysterol-binding protein-related protein 2A-like isoform X3 [Carex littledalei]
MHEYQGLLRPIFRILDVDQKAWVGLEETAASSEEKFHVGAWIGEMPAHNSVAAETLYCLMRILKAAAIAVVSYASLKGRPRKPFNPLLGETYEANFPERGIRFISGKALFLRWL